MKVLALDTTTPILSVALLDGRNLLAMSAARAVKTTSSRLFPIIDHVLSMAGVDKKELECVALTVGPGSFTGVRIGVAAVKAFAYALDLKVVAVSTLEAMAYLHPVEGVLLFPLLDARRSQYYGAMFRWLCGECQRMTEDMLLDKEQVERVASSVLFVGEAAEHFSQRYLPAGAIAFAVGMAALDRIEKGEFTSLAHLKPVYLRLSDAEESAGIVVYKT